VQVIGDEEYLKTCVFLIVFYIHDEYFPNQHRLLFSSPAISIFISLLLCPSRVVKNCDEFICYSLSVYSHNLKTTWPNFTNFLRVLPVAVARSSSDGVVICYVLPVLWMTSCFHIMGLRGRIMEDMMFRRSLQGDCIIPAGRQTTTVFSSVRQNAALRQSVP